VNEREQLTLVTAALLNSMSYSNLSKETIKALLDQAQDVVSEINKREEKRGNHLRNV
jgi:hypothetical protein